MVEVAANVPHFMDCTFGPGLEFVFMRVQDVTGGAPGTLAATVQAVETLPGTYSAPFTPTLGSKYIAQMASYTDDTLEEYDSNFNAGSISFEGVESSGGGGGGSASNELYGVLEDNGPLTSVVGNEEDCS